MVDSQTQHSASASYQALLGAAKELFVLRGYDGVSTRDLAEAAGVNLGAIQYHFGSKANLFIATVHDLMQNCRGLSAELEIPPSGCSPLAAAEKLALFVRSMLTHILRPSGPLGSRLVCREALLDIATRDEQMFRTLVSSMVEHFSRPMHDRLIYIFRTLQGRARPQSPSGPEDDFLSSCVGSLVGQCTFYLTHRPFVEELLQQDLSRDPHFENLVKHITTFTLRGLGCEQELISALTFSPPTHN